MTERSTDASSPPEQAEALRRFREAGSSVDWMPLWAVFVIFALVGVALSGDRQVDVGDLAIGLPAAFVIAWIADRSGLAGFVLAVALMAGGLAIGLFG